MPSRFYRRFRAGPLRYEHRQLTTPAIAAHMPTLRATLRRAAWAIAMLFIAGVALMLGAAVLPR